MNHKYWQYGSYASRDVYSHLLRFHSSFIYFWLINHTLWKLGQCTSHDAQSHISQFCICKVEIVHIHHVIHIIYWHNKIDLNNAHHVMYISYIIICVRSRVINRCTPHEILLHFHSFVWLSPHTWRLSNCPLVCWLFL